MVSQAKKDYTLSRNIQRTFYNVRSNNRSESLFPNDADFILIIHSQVPQARARKS